MKEYFWTLKNVTQSILKNLTKFKAIKELDPLRFEWTLKGERYKEVIRLEYVNNKRKETINIFPGSVITINFGMATGGYVLERDDETYIIISEYFSKKFCIKI